MEGNVVGDTNMKLSINSTDNTTHLQVYDTTSGDNVAFKTLQEQLISGTNIKTINNQSILGSGNIDIGSGTGGNANLNLNTTDETAFISNNTESMAFDLANERLIVSKPNEYYK